MVVLWSSHCFFLAENFSKEANPVPLIWTTPQKPWFNIQGMGVVTHVHHEWPCLINARSHFLRHFWCVPQAQPSFTLWLVYLSIYVCMYVCMYACINGNGKSKLFTHNSPSGAWVSLKMAYTPKALISSSKIASDLDDNMGSPWSHMAGWEMPPTKLHGGS